MSSSKSTRSPATYCLSNDVSVWVAPAFIKSNDLIKVGATQTETSLLKQYVWADWRLADWRSPWEGETSLNNPNFPSFSDVLKQYVVGERVDLLDDYDSPARTITEIISLLFQWWFLLGNHNHQANPHVHQQHIVLATTFRSGLPW